jgi:hypothetical protein
MSRRADACLAAVAAAAALAARSLVSETDED